VSIPQLQTWVSEDEYKQTEVGWQEQLELREESKDKLSDLKRYEDKVREALFAYNRQRAIVAKVSTLLLRRSITKAQAYTRMH
jgi:hypothetical protein